ncbi:hypothetical protein NVP1273O_70 [Vibrio phage 1.273.O._10N.286.54.C7]|nr:hypothetical protein NVP1273O_70 [Vibrio phage 1.273.O._10N.286.54.C7]
MTTYNTYQEAKIAHPESEIYFIGNEQYRTGEWIDQYNFGRSSFVLCNPADHCMTVEKFLADGHKFVDGDYYSDMFGDPQCVGGYFPPSDVNKPDSDDKKRYILRAAALENIPTETPEEKEVLDSIESVDDVEWKNGDECVISQKSKSKWLVVGVSPLAKTSTVCVSNAGELKSFHTDQLKKPETPQQREDRERLEAAGYLLGDWFNAIGKDMPEWSSINEDVKAHYLRIVDETNYRKEKAHATN